MRISTSALGRIFHEWSGEQEQIPRESVKSPESFQPHLDVTLGAVDELQIFYDSVGKKKLKYLFRNKPECEMLVCVPILLTFSRLEHFKLTLTNMLRGQTSGGILWGHCGDMAGRHWGH